MAVIPARANDVTTTRKRQALLTPLNTNKRRARASLSGGGAVVQRAMSSLVKGTRTAVNTNRVKPKYTAVNLRQSAETSAVTSPPFHNLGLESDYAGGTPIPDLSWPTMDIPSTAAPMPTPGSKRSQVDPFSPDHSVCITIGNSDSPITGTISDQDLVQQMLHPSFRAAVTGVLSEHSDSPQHMMRVLSDPILLHKLGIDSVEPTTPKRLLATLSPSNGFSPSQFYGHALLPTPDARTALSPLNKHQFGATQEAGVRTRVSPRCVRSGTKAPFLLFWVDCSFNLVPSSCLAPDLLAWVVAVRQTLSCR